MPLTEEAMKKFRITASQMEPPPADPDGFLRLLFNLIENRFDRARGTDSVQLALGEKHKNSGRTQEEHDSLPDNHSDNRKNDVAGPSGETS